MPNKPVRLTKDEYQYILSKRMNLKEVECPSWLLEMTDGREELLPNLSIKGTTAILCDIHLGFHDITAIKTAIQYISKQNVENIVLNGDTLDAHSLSRWRKSRNDIDLLSEIALAKYFLTNLEGTFPKAKIFFKIGNHEDRLESYIAENAAAFEGLLSWKELLELDKRGIELVGSNQIIECNGTWIAHGHELKISGGRNPASTLLAKTLSNVCIGHLHRTSTAYDITLEREPKRADVIGTLSKLQRAYNPYSKSNHGFAILQSDGQMRNIKIQNGRIEI